jgi:hypothetical protein
MHIRFFRRSHKLQSKRQHVFCSIFIGFVGFVINLVNRPTDDGTVQRPKKNYFSFAFENVKLRFSLRAPKKVTKTLYVNDSAVNLAGIS